MLGSSSVKDALSSEPDPIALGPDQGETAHSAIAGQVTFKVRGKESAGGLMVFEGTIAAKEGPPLHTHANEDEAIYVVDGEFRFKLGERIEPAPAGSFTFIPRGTPHTWQNIGEAQGRILVMFTPAGMERFFEGMASISERGPEAFERLGPEIGMAVVGPPLAQSDPL